MLSVSGSESAVEADLVDGRLACPGCSGALSPWGYARARAVRMLHGTRLVRSRRGWCPCCEATHVISPAWCVPGRRDGSEVIGEALVQAAGGDGHRRIAGRLGRPAGTVRGWLRAARRCTEALRRAGVRWALCWMASSARSSRPVQRSPRPSRRWRLPQGACGCSNLATGRDLSRTDSPLSLLIAAGPSSPRKRRPLTTAASGATVPRGYFFWSEMPSWAFSFLTITLIDPPGRDLGENRIWGSCS